MHVAVDVQYWEPEDRARAAAVGFADWLDAQPVMECAREHRGLAAYESGQFYKRELPCLLPLVNQLRAVVELETIVVDGYVDLAPGRPGLGRHLFDALGRDIVVVGVAKSAFVGSEAIRVCRAGSDRALWVTATDDAAIAAERLARMHGEHRIPTLLKRADSLARSAT